MTPPATLTTPGGATRIAAPPLALFELGPLGRAGAWFVVHGRLVAIVWAVLVIGLGAFAPGVERALSGAGWEATGSQSVQVRNTVNREFHGLSSYGLTVVLHDPTATAADPAFQRVISRVQAILRHDPRVSTVTTPQAGASISRDGAHRAGDRWGRPRQQRDGPRR